MARNAKKFDHIKKQGRDESRRPDECGQVVYGKKSLVPGCNTLVYRKSKQHKTDLKNELLN